MSIVIENKYQDKKKKKKKKKEKVLARVEGGK
jgi:hypothetical protein